MRLFLALDLDASLADAAAAWADGLAAKLGPSGSRALRWTAPDQRHVTVHFLGEVDPARADALRSRLVPGLTLARFDVGLDGAGLFPVRGAPRVIWVGLRDRAGELARLHHALGEHLSALELPVEARPFHPHITLARVRHDADRQLGRQLRQWCEANPPPPAQASITVVTLYRSHLSPAGSRYEVLLRAPLSAA